MIMTKTELALKLLKKKKLTKSEQYMVENFYNEQTDELYICEIGTLAVRKRIK